jgi:hypothetical protein
MKEAKSTGVCLVAGFERVHVGLGRCRAPRLHRDSASPAAYPTMLQRCRESAAGSRWY